MNHLYSLARQRTVATLARQYVSPVQVYLDTNPNDRDHYAIPSLVTLVTDTLLGLSRYELKLDPRLFTQTKVYLHSLLDSLETVDMSQENLRYGAPPQPEKAWVKVEGGGRKLDMDIDRLRDLSRLGFTDEEMGEVLGCCRRTIQRRRKQHSIKKYDWADLSDDDLLLYIERVLRLGSGNEGEKGVRTGLEELGVHVRRDDVRRLLLLFERGPLATAPRPITRRIYRVPWANSLWHMDGHHKLINWKIVIHGAIDGFSRLIVFLQASDNNRAETVRRAFEGAVEMFGWPSRVRVDHGGENLEVGRLMERYRGSNRGSFIQGSSQANQRIERVWVDVQRWCTRRYKQLFINMEQIGILNVDNPFHLWTLHFCYLPMINRALGFMVNRWNKHGLRTEGNNSPMKIWVKNVLQAERLGVDILADPTGLTEVEEGNEGGATFTNYGVGEWGSRVRLHWDADEPHVMVEPVLEEFGDDVAAFMSSREMRDYMETIAGPPWPPTEDFGVSRYVRVLQEVHRLVSGTHPHVL